MISGEGENFFSQEKRFSPSTDPNPFQEKCKYFVENIIIAVKIFYLSTRVGNRAFIIRKNNTVLIDFQISHCELFIFFTHFSVEPELFLAQDDFIFQSVKNFITLQENFYGNHIA